MGETKGHLEKLVACVTASLLLFAVCVSAFETIEFSSRRPLSMTVFFKQCILLPVEFVLAVWLLSGRYRQCGFLAGVVLFAGFLGASAWFWISGENSCGCFGQIKISPWITLIVDAGVLAALVLSIPRVAEQRLEKLPREFLLRLCALLSVSFIALSCLFMGTSAITGDIVDFKNGTGNKTVRIGNNLPSLNQFLSCFESSPTIDKVTKAVPERLVFVLYRNDCESCRKLVNSIEEFAPFCSTKFVLSALDEGNDQNSVSNGYPLLIATLDTVSWTTQTPAFLYYDSGRPVKFDSGVKGIGDIHWPQKSRQLD